MDIQEYPTGDAVVWRLAGRLTGLGGTEPFDAALSRAVRDRRRAIVLDLGGVSLVDAGGLGLVATVCRLGAMHNLQLSLARVPPRVRRLLTVTRLATVLPMFDTLEASLPEPSFSAQL